MVHPFPSDQPTTPDCPQCKTQKPRVPFCAVCGRLQEFPLGTSYFSVFGLTPRLAILESALQTKYYELARKFHPDRFTQSSPDEAHNALTWTTALTRGFKILREPFDRSRYLLELFNGAPDPKAPTQVPLDLAETYFEIQEMREQGGNNEALLNFKNELTSLLESLETEWQGLAAEWDRAASFPDKGTTLKKLQNYLMRRKYVESMLRDIGKSLEESPK